MVIKIVSDSHQKPKPHKANPAMVPIPAATVLIGPSGIQFLQQLNIYFFNLKSVFKISRLFL